MTKRKIRFTKHCRDRMQERSIRKREVIEVIRHGEKVTDYKRKSNKYYIDYPDSDYYGIIVVIKGNTVVTCYRDTVQNKMMS